MSEEAGREQMERKLVEKCLEDESFRQRLLADPRAAVEEELGTRLPEEVRVVAVEETADTIYLVPFSFCGRPIPYNVVSSQRIRRRRDLVSYDPLWPATSSGSGLRHPHGAGSLE